MKSPRALGLPYDDWRPGQRLAILSAQHAKRTHMVVQAPTGSGKSVIAAALTQLTDYRAVVLTATKGLMDQYASTFPHLYDVRGAGNYECLAAKDEFKAAYLHRRGPLWCDKGPCHGGASCTLKDNGCLYFDRYRGALAARTVLTNYSYWLSMRRFAKGLGAVQTLILDEAHALPEQLMGACRIEIPTFMLDSRNVPKSHKTWREWAERMIAMTAVEGDDDTRVKKEKLRQDLTNLRSMDESWAWDLWQDKIIFEPTIPRLLLPMLYTPDRESHVVYLSATATPSMLRLLDIPEADIESHEMKSTFPVERRPVYVVGGVRVDFRSMQNPENQAKWIESIDRILDDRPDRKGIIHTVSYDRQQILVHASRHAARFLVPTRSQDLLGTVERLRTSPEPYVLVSPSVSTGFDFPYTDCEFQIIAKVPFPDTRSAIARARIKSTPGYRDHLTMQTLVQMCGRGMRAADDRCETFIVDQHARWFLEQAGELAPRWFTESIVRTGRRVRPAEKLKERGT